ncbi:DNA transfer protein [Helicobacter cholecystus]|nr:DNA transfer protein [Helicobacter cholecystus]
MGWTIFLGVCVIVFCLMGWMRYQNFLTYIQAKHLNAKVLAQYTKGNKWVLKLITPEGQIIYTTSKEDLKDLTYKELSLYGKSMPCDFIQSLKSCFFVTYSFSLLPTSSTPLLDWVSSQHSDILLTRLYQSLFFATPLPKPWREWSSKLHISHLFAISGLHLGIFAWLLYILLGKPYKFFQARYFTYRNNVFDIGAIVMVILLVYAYILNFPPAYVRAFVMSAVGMLFVWGNIKVLSFHFLFLCVCVILAIFPQFIVNFGFWFSVSGVYFILLFFKYFNAEIKGVYKILLIALLLNSALFFQMLPISHYIFPTFYLYSLCAIILSLIFPLFFILSLFAHLLGIGGVFDEGLSWALDFSLPSKEIFTPFWVFYPYVFFCILALRYRSCYYATLGIGGAFYIFLVLKMLR